MDDRQLSFKILNKIERDKAYSNLTLDAYLDEYKGKIFSPAFVTALVYGVIERKITLDFVLSEYLTQPIKKLKPEVLIILRMGTYQLKFMDSIPDSAVVNESVKLTKKNGCAYASGLVNSVLRKIAKNDIKYPNTDDKISDISIKYSCPKELVSQFCKDYGIENAEGILSCSIGSSGVSIRVNTLKTNTDDLIKRLESNGAECEICSQAENHIKIKNFGAVENTQEFKQGLFHVQDISSALCVKALELSENMTFIDVCSAPGGKAFTAAQYMNNKGKIYAFDLYEHRVKLINKGAERLGINIIDAQTGDASVLNNQLKASADRVLADVPCSGLGIIGRKPEIRYKDLEFIDKLTDLQYNILTNASEYVAENGLLVYSTCSLNKKENDCVCDRFLKSRSDFEKHGDYTTLMPHINGTDGFFIAVFRRKHFG